MFESIFQQLIYNAALLLITALLFDILKNKFRRNWFGFQRILVGLVLSIIGIMLMLNPWTFAPGIIFDTRSILLSISGLFFGLVPTIIAMVCTTAFRLYQGGAAAWTGVSVIIATGSIGIIWRYLRNKNMSQISLIELYLFGLINHVVMLLLMLTLPIDTALRVLAEISFPVLFIYPLATMILGYLLVNRANWDNVYKTLQEREKQLSLAVHAANIGFYETDLGTGAAHHSTEWKKQLGYEDDEIRDNNMEWESRLHPDDKVSTLEKFKAGVESGENLYEYNFRLRHKDGSYRWILSRGMVQRDQSGNAVSVVGCHVDVTEQKEFEQAVVANEQRFRGLADSSQDVIVLFNCNIKPEYINPAGLRSTTLKETNKNFVSDNETIAEQIFADFKEDLEDILAGGKISQRLVYLKENGKSLVYDTRLSPVLNGSGQVEWVLGVSRDITSILLIETKLKESEEKFRRIFETSGLGISITDLSGNFLSGNPAVLEILGYDYDEYCLLNVADVSHPEDKELNLQMLEEYKAGKRDSFELEKKVIRKDGQVLWAKLISTLVSDENGRPLFMIGMIEDISDRKLADEKEKSIQLELQKLLDNADQSRRALLSVIEDQRITEDELKRLAKDLLVAYDSTLQGWSSALELREQETAGHSRRVVALTLEIARSLGVEVEDLAHMERGALLHDIGKMGIPDSILLKPGPLSDDEWVVMKKHPVYAFNLLSKIDFLKQAIEIPYSHHERWDGSGYPQGLASEEIPLAARIFAVVDIWDALASDRPYRSAWQREDIINFIKGISGKHLDPKIVEVFLQIIENGSSG
jgi:PAS domain S-box-containing protein/putative nucleotidyltransferase with HDIG domain